MKSSDEIRAEAWKICRSRGCFWAFFVTWTVLSMFFGLVRECWQQAISSMGIQTWTMFMQAKAKALLSGLDLAVPSRAVAWRMTGASAFELFVSCIVVGIIAFGLSGFFMRTAKGDMSRWFIRSLEGFRRPLDLAWLHLHFSLRCVIAFAVFYFVPVVCGAFLGGVFQLALAFGGTVLALFGVVVVFYRCCQCWNLKVENPDVTACQCLRESARMMKGNMWRRFKLDCSYWKPATLWFVGVLTAAALQIAPGLPLVVEFFKFALGIACSIGFVVLLTYYGIGQALFYLDLKKVVEVKN